MKLTKKGWSQRESVEFTDFPGAHDTEREIDLEVADIMHGFTNGRIRNGWVYWACNGLWRTRSEFLR